jgi:molybdate transport system substrate-binding protein
MTAIRHLAAAALSILTVGSADADELAILSAAAVRPALIQVPPVFAKSTGHQVTVSFGNATAIQNRVAAGDRVDLVILPPKQLDELIARDLLVQSSRADLGAVGLGIAIKANAEPKALATSAAFKDALLAAPSFAMPDPADGSTSSQHLVKVLQQLGIADAMRGKTRLFPDGTQALQAVAHGEIAITVAPVTSIHVVPGVKLAAPLPQELQLKTVYAAALTRRSAASPAANALLTMLKSPQMAAIFQAKGVDPP